MLIWGKGNVFFSFKALQIIKFAVVGEIVGILAEKC